MVYSLHNMLLNLIYQYYVEGFYRSVYKRYWSVIFLQCLCLALVWGVAGLDKECFVFNFWKCFTGIYVNSLNVQQDSLVKLSCPGFSLYEGFLFFIFKKDLCVYFRGKTRGGRQKGRRRRREVDSLLSRETKDAGLNLNEPDDMI